MTNRLFQTIIYQVQYAFADRKAGVIDENGTIIACTDISSIGEICDEQVLNIKSGSDPTILNGVTYKRIGARTRDDYVVFCTGTDQLSQSGVIISNNYMMKNMIKSVSLRIYLQITLCPLTFTAKHVHYI